MNWQHKDEWRTHGADFCIVVSRHTVALDEFDSEGPNRWAVYAYIYPNHPHFAKFEGKSMWQDATELGLHGGCSFLKWHTDEKCAVTSIQVGADYRHLDDNFTHFATQDDARKVFKDAENLFARLERMNQKEVAA